MSSATPPKWASIWSARMIEIAIVISAWRSSWPWFQRRKTCCISEPDARRRSASRRATGGTSSAASPGRCVERRSRAPSPTRSPLQLERDVAAEQEERAVRHVDDAHQPEDEREAARDDEVERRRGDAVEQRDQEVLRVVDGRAEASCLDAMNRTQTIGNAMTSARSTSPVIRSALLRDTLVEAKLGETNTAPHPSARQFPGGLSQRKRSPGAAGTKYSRARRASSLWGRSSARRAISPTTSRSSLEASGSRPRRGCPRGRGDTSVPSRRWTGSRPTDQRPRPGYVAAVHACLTRIENSCRVPCQVLKAHDSFC